MFPMGDQHTISRYTQSKLNFYICVVCGLIMCNGACDKYNSCSSIYVNAVYTVYNCTIYIKDGQDQVCPRCQPNDIINNFDEEVLFEENPNAGENFAKKW